MKLFPPRVLALAVLSTALGAPSAAHAFCRTMTGRDPSDPPTLNKCATWNAADPDVQRCCPYGKPIFWRNECVGFSLQQSASQYVSLNDAEQTMITAFNRWTGITCPSDGTGSSRVSIDVRYLGPVNCGTVQYNKNGPNQHVIIFRDDAWNHQDANNTLGLTTVNYDPDTGEILDADMEINTYSTQKNLTVKGDPPPDGYDLQSIVTHEAGHFLGLAHTIDDRATMFAQYKPGSTHMRNLTIDDVQGICSIYLPNGQRGNSDPPVAGEACDPTPRGGYALDCGSAPAKSCAVSPGSENAGDGEHGSGGAGVMASLAVLGAVVARRRLRRG